jgi:hypothetical protein
MEEIEKEGLKLFTAVVTHWGTVMAISAIVSLAYRRFTKRQNQFNHDMAVDVKRLEVCRAIDNDYGLPLVSELVKEYEDMGGNHYVHALFEKYKEKKMKEIEV